MSKRVLALDEIMQAVAPILSYRNITEAKVFGSYAKGCATPYSDVDIYVDSGLRGLSFFGLLEEIVCALPIPVDLVDKYTLIPGGELYTEIMKTGIDISIPVVPDIENMEDEAMKQMNLDNPISTKDPLGDFHFPGWYRDVEGALCLVIKEHLISVSYNEAAKEYNVCVNVLGSRGLFDENVLWESFGAGIPAKQCALNAVQRVHEGTL